MSDAGQYPTVSRYTRIPTRTKVRFGWACLAASFAWWQLLKLTIFRVNPKRAEMVFLNLEGQPISESLEKDLKAQRLMRDALSVSGSAALPNPGEVTAALQTDMDNRRLAYASSHVIKNR